MFVGHCDISAHAYNVCWSQQGNQRFPFSDIIWGGQGTSIKFFSFHFPWVFWSPPEESTPGTHSRERKQTQRSFGLTTPPPGTLSSSTDEETDSLNSRLSHAARSGRAGMRAILPISFPFSHPGCRPGWLVWPQWVPELRWWLGSTWLRESPWQNLWKCSQQLCTSRFWDQKRKFQNTESSFMLNILLRLKAGSPRKPDLMRFFSPIWIHICTSGFSTESYLSCSAGAHRASTSSLGYREIMQSVAVH